jgi:CRISPR-associated protein Csd1
MILKELADLAHREGLVEDPDFVPSDKVRWIIEIGRGGRLHGVIDAAQSDGRGKARPNSIQIPRRGGRTSGSVADFLVDKAEYVLGFDPDDQPKKRARLGNHRALFIEYIESALALEPDEPGLAAVLAFLRDDTAVARCIERARDLVAANDLFAFRYTADGDPESGWLVHDRQKVRAAWSRMRGAPAKREAAAAECLVCGERRAPIDKHPQVQRVPGGSSSGIALVSFNAPAFESLGLEGNANAPVCRPCAEAYATALNRLFNPAYPVGGRALGRRSFRLSDDTAVVYWAAQENPLEEDFTAIDYDPANPEQATAFYKSVFKGWAIALDDPTAFYALIISGAQGRMTLRGYHQTTVGKAVENLRRYFEDIVIVRRFPNSPEWPPLSLLVRSLAAQGKFKNVDQDLAGRLFLAILSGAPFPTAVLQAAIGRIRSEPEDPGRGRSKHTRERLALIRATLNRWFRAGDRRVTSLISREITPVLDETYTNHAYCLGRLFATLESLQQAAIGPKSTITDRFYGAASATPAAVFSQLIRKSNHHLGSLRNKGEREKRLARFFKSRIQEICDLLPAGPFPPTLSLPEQGLFALGYYHQRASRKTGEATSAPPTEATSQAE